MNINKDQKGRTLYYACVDLLLEKDGKFLLGRRMNTGWNDGKWCTFGGHIEDEETIQQAAVREAKEELGITINPDALEIANLIQYKSNRLTMQFYVIVKHYEGTPSIQVEWEQGKEIVKADKLEWFSPDNLPENTVETAKAAILNHQNGVRFDQMGF